MTMQHRRNGISGDPIVIRDFASFKQDKAISQQRIRISELAEAGKRIADDYPELVGWFLLQVMGGRETAVEKGLQAEKIEAVVLREEEQVVVRRGRKWTLPGKPWLPGFVLVRCVPSAGAFRGLLGFQSVMGIVGGWAKPYRVPDDSISEFNTIMLMREEERERLRVEQEAKNADIKVGDRVRIKLGPFKGFEAKVLTISKGQAKRCKVQYKLYGHDGTASIPLANLEAL